MNVYYVWLSGVRHDRQSSHTRTLKTAASVVEVGINHEADDPLHYSHQRIRSAVGTRGVPELGPGVALVVALLVKAIAVGVSLALVDNLFWKHLGCSTFPEFIASTFN